MIIYPAIDLKGGQCVRLVRGEMDSATVYNEDPAAQAHEFARLGFSWIHVVDLDGAFSGAPANEDAVRAIIDAADLPIQVGGGIRTLETIEHWLEAGVSRVILGTVAVKNPDLVLRACEMFPEQVALGIDARNGMVATEGWAESSDMPAVDLARTFEDAGAAAIIYTDIDRDGTGQGLNIDQTRALALAVSIPVIASGGAGSMEDLKQVQLAQTDGVTGVIVGKALYDGRIVPKDALALAAATTGPLLQG